MGSVTKLRSGAMLFSIDGPVTSCSRPSFVQAVAQFLPEGVVGPLLHLVGQRHLQVVAAARLAALRTQRKAARRIHVDQFVIHRRRVDSRPSQPKG
jgi:hypothetical protein